MRDHRHLLHERRAQLPDVQDLHGRHLHQCRRRHRVRHRPFLPSRRVRLHQHLRHGGRDQMHGQRRSDLHRRRRLLEVEHHARLRRRPGMHRPCAGCEVRVSAGDDEVPRNLPAQGRLWSVHGVSRSSAGKLLLV